MKNGEQVRKILRSLPRAWQPKVIALECQDLDKISCDELLGDLIAFEKTHLNIRVQEEKKKIVAFKTTMAKSEKEEEGGGGGGEQDENIAMLSKVISNMMRRTRNGKRGKPNFRKGKAVNDGRCYECGKIGHIQAECPNLKKKVTRNYRNKKSFGAWSDEEESNHKEIANMCFMVIGENSDEEESDNEGTNNLSLMAAEGRYVHLFVINVMSFKNLLILLLSI